MIVCVVFSIVRLEIVMMMIDDDVVFDKESFYDWLKVVRFFFLIDFDKENFSLDEDGNFCFGGVGLWWFFFIMIVKVIVGMNLWCIVGCVF